MIAGILLAGLAFAVIAGVGANLVMGGFALPLIVGLVSGGIFTVVVAAVILWNSSETTENASKTTRPVENH